jgi:hypothetical protein
MMRKSLSMVAEKISFRSLLFSRLVSFFSCYFSTPSSLFPLEYIAEFVFNNNNKKKKMPEYDGIAVK